MSDLDQHADSEGARPGLVGSSTFDKKVNFLERDDFDEELALTHEVMLELSTPPSYPFFYPSKISLNTRGKFAPA